MSRDSAMQEYRDLQEILLSDKNLLLVGHTNPDGDCIGSLTGLFHFITDKTGRTDNINMVVPNDYPYFLEFLDENRRVMAYDKCEEEINRLVDNADVVVCMDFNSFKRVEKLGERISACKASKILIDHHPFPDRSQFDIAVSRPELSSTCEVVYSLIKGWCNSEGNERALPLAAAVSLYTGLVTDTNNFANSVLPSSFIMAGELMQTGVDKEWVQSMIYGGFHEDRMRLMGYMLHENMKIFPELKAAIMILDKRTKERYNFQDGDSEGFVNLALGIKDIAVSGFFTEADGFIKVSLRSKEGYSVNDLAKEYFNGGGHARASGGRIYIPVDEVERYFIEALEKFKQKA